MYLVKSNMGFNSMKKEIAAASLKHTKVNNRKDASRTMSSFKIRLTNNFSNKDRQMFGNNQKMHGNTKPSRDNNYSFKEGRPLFSLLDVNDKITNSKGPCLPAQYLRSTLEYYTKLQNTSNFNTSLRNDNYEQTQPKKINKQRSESAKNIIQDNNETNDHQTMLQSYNDKSKSLVKNGKDTSNMVKSASCSDIFEYPNNKNKYQNASSDVIKAKGFTSDVFFLKGGDEERDGYKSQGENYPFQQKSDIFLLKNNGNGKFYNQNATNYNYLKDHKSEWFSNNISMPTLLNHTSTQFDIINHRKVSAPKTKTEIITECNKMGKGFNPANKQNNLSEYIDLARVSNYNRNNAYHSYYNEHLKPFNRRKNIFSNYLDIHKNYNHICDLPFVKKKFL